MSAASDFFAFAGDAFEPEKKKAKKEKHKKHKKRTKDKESAKLDNVVTKGLGKSPSNYESDLTDSKINQVSSAEKVEAEDLENLLGISDDIVSTVGADEKTKFSRVPKTTVEYSENDEFLENLDKELSVIKEETNDIGQVLGSYQSLSKIVLNGKEVSVKEVKFTLNVWVVVVDREIGPVSMKVKGSTKFSNICKKLVELFKAEKNLNFDIESKADDLCFYIEDLNIILEQDLKVFALLAYRTKLAQAPELNEFIVDAVLTTNHEALNLKVAKEKVNVQLDDEDHEDNDTVVVFLKENSEELKMLVTKTMNVSELMAIYILKKKYPDSLNLELIFNGELLNKDSIIGSYDLKDKSIIDVQFNQEELERLKVENTENVDLESGIGDEDDGSVFEGNTEKLDEGYFSIYMVGKDGNKFKIKVKHDTKIQNIVDYYIAKAKLSKNTRLKLIFDDEPLEISGIIGDTELEEDFIVDVVILS